MTDARKAWDHGSPSQITTFRRCHRKWFFESVRGFRSPSTAAQERGTEIHAQLETYHKTGKTPTDKAALAAIEYMPAPGTVRPEHIEFGFQLWIPGAPVPMIGFIDLLEPPRLVTDYKSTSDFVYMKAPEQLQGDPQSVTYCVVSCAPQVIGAPFDYKGETLYPVEPVWHGPTEFRHVYMRTRGAAIARESRVLYDTRDTLFGELDGITRDLTAMHGLSRAVTPEEVPANTDACDDYNGCPHRVRCAAAGSPTMGRMSGLFMPTERKITTPMDPKIQALLDARKSMGNKVAGASATLPKTPAEHVTKIKGEPVILQVCTLLASRGISLTVAVSVESAPGEWSSLVGRGIVTSENMGKAAQLTTLGVEVFKGLGLDVGKAPEKAQETAAATGGTSGTPAAGGGILNRFRRGATPPPPDYSAKRREVIAAFEYIEGDEESTDADVLAAIRRNLEAGDAIEAAQPDPVFGSLLATWRANAAELESRVTGDDVSPLESTPAGEPGCINTDDYCAEPVEGPTDEILAIWSRTFGFDPMERQADARDNDDDGSLFAFNDCGAVLALLNDGTAIIMRKPVASSINPPGEVEKPRTTPEAPETPAPVETPPKDAPAPRGRPPANTLPDGTVFLRSSLADLVEYRKKWIKELDADGSKLYASRSLIKTNGRKLRPEYIDDLKWLTSVINAQRAGTLADLMDDSAGPVGPGETAAANDDPESTDETGGTLDTLPPVTGNDKAPTVDVNTVSGGVLYVNCLPMSGGGKVVDFARFCEPLEAEVAADAKVPHVQLISHRAGYKTLAALIAVRCNQGSLSLPASMYIDTTHPGATDALPVLSVRYGLVIRAIH